MSNDYIYYVESNLVCFLIFGIMWVHDRFNLDRQEKQIKYDHALIAFMCYFVSDSLWLAVTSEVITKNTYTAILVNFLNYIIMAALTYMWLRYVMATEQVPHRERKLNKFAIIFPFIISTLVLVIMYLIAPDTLITPSFDMTPLFNVIFAVVPSIYLVAVLVYTMTKVKNEKSPIARRRHLYIGFLPIMVMIGGFVQIAVLPTIPIFCFCCTVLMLIFYIQSMYAQISVDPLTKLNNRGQLVRYMTNESNLNKDGKITFVTMMDVNDFKLINDTYGHSEGDKALIIVADVLKAVIENYNAPSFLGRYGGDEFILVIQLAEEKSLIKIIDEIHEKISEKCDTEQTPYKISIGIGYDELLGKNDSMQRCIQRADHKLYLDKERSKIQGITTMRR